MKHTFIYTLLTIAITIGACSKGDKSPTLKVHVQELDGTLAPGATVRVWAGLNNTSGILDEDVIDQSGVTDAVGDIIFEFENSVVLDIDVIYYKTDTLNGRDTLEGSKVVKIETVRQVSDDNMINETIEVN
jgi:hypothetical protein